MKFTVGIVGGGIAGSTIALKLAQKGIQSILFQSGSSLVNGPPFCHLHAGGALYREIPTQECLKMLKESIKTVKCYPFSVNLRPTLLTVPIRDPGTPEQIINRMNILTECYKKLIQIDESNAVLGKPEEYYRIFTREEVECLRQRECPLSPKSVEQWMIPPAKYLDLDKLKFPLVMVQQYGMSALRSSAFLNLSLGESQNCQLLLNKSVFRLEKTLQQKWQIFYKDNTTSVEQVREVDYLINACGYKSGIIDDMAGFKKNRMVEFKAAYVTEWNECQGKWPQVIIHGKRKTVNGMGQLTPYVGNMFQIHGMTEQITLFENGLSSTQDHSSQPKINEELEQILEEGWKQELVYARTMKAIQHIAAFIPSFGSACTPKKPLYGAQQIPGENPNLRSAEISYEANNYARAEIVKSSTAIEVAESFIDKITKQFNMSVSEMEECSQHQKMDALRKQSKEIERIARGLAVDRGYPEELALAYN